MVLLNQFQQIIQFRMRILDIVGGHQIHKNITWECHIVGNENTVGNCEGNAVQHFDGSEGGRQCLYTAQILHRETIILQTLQRLVDIAGRRKLQKHILIFKIKV